MLISKIRMFHRFSKRNNGEFFYQEYFFKPFPFITALSWGGTANDNANTRLLDFFIPPNIVIVKFCFLFPQHNGAMLTLTLVQMLSAM